MFAGDGERSGLEFFRRGSLSSILCVSFLNDDHFGDEVHIFFSFKAVGNFLVLIGGQLGKIDCMDKLGDHGSSLLGLADWKLHGL